MTLVNENKGFKSYMREVEVVEHREEASNLFNTVKDKMIENFYESNTILACLILTQSLYNFKEVSEELKKIESTISHVFVVFAGIPLSKKRFTNR